MAQDLEPAPTPSSHQERSSAPPSGGAPPGWYPDPEGTEAFRWWDGGHWSDAKTWTLPGAVIAPPRQSPRRRWWPWLLAGGLVVLMLIGFAALVVVGVDETYTADLTQGHGDFPEATMENAATSYQADGLHLAINETGGWAESGLWTAGTHTDLGVEIAASPVVTTPEAGFGPWCWGKSGDGYGLALYGDGTATLVEQVGDQYTELARATSGAWLETGQRRLWLTCSMVVGSDSIHLVGYVDGQEIIETSTASNITAIGATGFAGYTKPGTPAEWTVANFWRHDAGTKPA